MGNKGGKESKDKKGGDKQGAAAAKPAASVKSVKIDIQGKDLATIDPSQLAHESVNEIWLNGPLHISLER